MDESTLALLNRVHRSVMSRFIYIPDIEQFGFPEHWRSPDEIPDPHSLDIKLWQNGELRQSDNTIEMIFKIPHLISYISKVTTLYPGDIIATGTPAGVGPVKHGDKLVAKIDRIGTLEVLIEE